MTVIEAAAHLETFFEKTDDQQTRAAIQIVVRYVRSCPDLDAIVEAARTVGGDRFLVQVIEQLAEQITTARRDAVAWEDAHAKACADAERTAAAFLQTIARLEKECDDNAIARQRADAIARDDDTCNTCNGTGREGAHGDYNCIACDGTGARKS